METIPNGNHQQILMRHRNENWLQADTSVKSHNSNDQTPNPVSALPRCLPQNQSTHLLCLWHPIRCCSILPYKRAPSQSLVRFAPHPTILLQNDCSWFSRILPIPANTIRIVLHACLHC